MPNIQSLERAFFLLESLGSAEKVGLSLTELSRLGTLKLPTCRNILATLQDLGYVQQLPANRRYALTDKGTFSGETNNAEALAAYALPALQSLLRQVEETVILCLYINHQRRTLVALESQQQLKVSANLGEDQNFYSTATGRILLSQLTAKELQSLLGKLPAPAADWPEFDRPNDRLSLLAGIRQRAEVIFNKGGMVTALAVPIVFSRRRLRAAVGLYYPAARHPGTTASEFIVALRETARKIAAF